MRYKNYKQATLFPCSTGTKMHKKAVQEQRQVIEKLAGIITEFFATPGKDTFLKYLPPEDLSQKIDLISDEKNFDWDVIFAWVEKYLKYSVRTNHPGFVNRMWTGANLPAIVGEIIAAISNTSACTYESAPVSTLMEKYMLDQMLDLAGFSEGVGQMTTGSSNANMIAMLAARNYSWNFIFSACLCHYARRLQLLFLDNSALSFCIDDCA
jgi:hypothetical protein